MCFVKIQKTFFPLIALTFSLSTSMNAPHLYGQTLAEGEFTIPAAEAFTDSGFHMTINVSHTLGDIQQPTAGTTIVVSLRDVSRPEQTCFVEHPTSGCATVDWSDFPSRPGVPPGGVFDNSLKLQLASGEHIFYLSESLILADEPDPFVPT